MMQKKLQKHKKSLATFVALWIGAGASAYAAAPVTDAQDLKAQTGLRSSQQSQLIAELVLQVNQLQQEVRQLRGQLEEQDYRLNQMVKQQRELYIDLDRRIQAGVATGDANADNNSKPLAATRDEVQAAYNKAFTQYKDKQYAFAKSSFKSFVANYPEEDLASNAHFWLGQLHLKDKEYEQAEAQFKAVYAEFPGANKTDVAILKLGQLEEARGNKVAAKGYYQKVAKDFANTTAGKLAKAKLDAL
ncbi:tol-pal system protein YbgF [Kangiella sp. TOML190]|uniref:tol-pal system protein YbgF n=1 Tax=Kangiella sp. TOML190 TaxID=2931351 RepID=UPI00203C16D5|nr:tol-pal system protein YbgF [Kangiella sp. TOML190]